MSYREHRRALRLEVSGEVITRFVGIAEPVELRDVGPGGFLVWSRVPIALQSVQQVQFITGDGWTSTLTARAVHARRVGARGQTPLHAIGFAFVFAPGEPTEAAVSRLIDKITAVLSFD